MSRSVHINISPLTLIGIHEISRRMCKISSALENISWKFFWNEILILLILPLYFVILHFYVFIYVAKHQIFLRDDLLFSVSEVFAM